MAKARESRISGGTRIGYTSSVNQVKKWARQVGRQHLLQPSLSTKDGEAIDLAVFTCDDFLDFIEWTVQHRDVGATTLSGYPLSLPT